MMWSKSTTTVIFVASMFAFACGETDRDVGAWRDLFVMDCNGAGHFMPSSPLAASMTFGGAKQFGKMFYNELRDRAMCEDPNVAEDDLFRYVIPSMQMLMSIFGGDPADFEFKAAPAFPTTGFFSRAFPFMNGIAVEQCEERSESTDDGCCLNEDDEIPDDWKDKEEDYYNIRQNCNQEDGLKWRESNCMKKTLVCKESKSHVSSVPHYDMGFLPTSCSKESVASGKGCQLQFNMRKTGVKLQLALDQCKNSMEPYISIHCSGAVCDNMFLPCVEEDECGKGLTCKSLMKNSADFEKVLENIGMTTDVAPLMQQCAADVAGDGVWWVYRRAANMVRSFFGHENLETEAIKSIKVCMPPDDGENPFSSFGEDMQVFGDIDVQTKALLDVETRKNKFEACLNAGCNAFNVGDGFCDTSCNNEACRFDGGDCAGPSAYVHNALGRHPVKSWTTVAPHCHGAEVCSDATTEETCNPHCSVNVDWDECDGKYGGEYYTDYDDACIIRSKIDGDLRVTPEICDNEVDGGEWHGSRDETDELIKRGDEKCRWESETYYKMVGDAEDSDVSMGYTKAGTVTTVNFPKYNPFENWDGTLLTKSGKVEEHKALSNVRKAGVYYPSPSNTVGGKTSFGKTVMSFSCDGTFKMGLSSNFMMGMKLKYLQKAIAQTYDIVAKVQSCRKLEDTVKRFAVQELRNRLQPYQLDRWLLLLSKKNAEEKREEFGSGMITWFEDKYGDERRPENDDDSSEGSSEGEHEHEHDGRRRLNCENTDGFAFDLPSTCNYESYSSGARQCRMKYTGLESLFGVKTGLLLEVKRCEGSLANALPAMAVVIEGDDTNKKSTPALEIFPPKPCVEDADCKKRSDNMVCQDLAGGLDLGDEGESSVNFDAVFYDNPKKFKVQEKERDFNEYQSWRDPPAFYIGGWRNKLKTECSSAKRFKQTLRTAMLLLSGDDNVGDSKDSLKFCVFDTKEIASNVQDLPKQLVEEVTSDNTCLYKMPNHLVTTVESAIKYGPKVTAGSDGTVAVTAAEGTTFANAKTTIKGLDKEIIQSQQETLKSSIVKAIRKSTGLDISDDDILIKDINEKGEIEFSIQVRKGDNDDNVKSVENALGNSATTNDILDEYKKDLEDIFDEEQLKDLALDTDVTSNGGAEEVTQSGDFVDPSTGGAGSDPNIDIPDDSDKDKDKDKDKDEDDECDGNDCVAAVDSAELHSTSAALLCIIVVRMLLGNLHVA